MRDINQIPIVIDTNNQPSMSASKRSVGLSYLLSIASTSALAKWGFIAPITLSLLLGVASLKTKPAHAHFSGLCPSLPDQIVSEKPLSPKSETSKPSQNNVWSNTDQDRLDRFNSTNLSEKPQEDWAVKDSCTRMRARFPANPKSQYYSVSSGQEFGCGYTNESCLRDFDRTVGLFKQYDPKSFYPSEDDWVSIEPKKLAQTNFEEAPERPLIPEIEPKDDNPLAPTLNVQGAFLNQVDTSARLRLQGTYPLSPHALFGATVDLTTGDGFSDTEETGLSLNELYFTTSVPSYSNLRFVVGLMDLTSYFDRNSFAKDSTTHFFNPVFQTNPALAAAGIASRPGVLLNWNLTDNLEVRAAGFSSDRDLDDFAFDGFSSELAFRVGTAIIRGTYLSARDAQKDGFQEIFSLNRGDNEFGPKSSDREEAYGINGELYIPALKMGLFGRYGWYENLDLDESGDTYSVGLNLLDLFMDDDRLGLGYGRQLSNDDLRRDEGNKVPDVWELFYDLRVSPNVRAGVTLQGRDEFSDTILGVRVRADFDVSNLWD
ncbi:MAG: carbohydrate porin [Moorea sp. SIO3C2]|nr:carbohydrate porin [Moorena sp. SIO3C2]